MRRFITYLYEFRNGEKGINIGFAKVDLQNDRLRLQIHLHDTQRIRHGSKQVFLITDSLKTEGILIGRLNESPRQTNVRWELPAQKIQSSPYDFDQIIGIALRFSTGVYAAGCWSDSPPVSIQSGDFALYMPSEADISRIDKPQAEFSADVKPQTKLSVAAKPRTELSAGVQLEAEHSAELQPHIDLSVPDQLEAEPSGELRPHIDLSAPRQLEAEPSGELQPHIDLSAPDQLEAEHSAELQPHIDLSAPAQSMDGVSTTFATEPAFFSGELPQSRSETQTLQPAEKAFSPEAFKPENKDNQHLAKHTHLSFKRIDLHDLQNLPSRNRHLCSNSFLLHGYLNYQYLILMERTEGDDKSVYLGVPGIYEYMESAMALLFNFPGFVTEKELANGRDDREENPDRKIEPGSFGFWLFRLQDTPVSCQNKLNDK